MRQLLAVLVIGVSGFLCSVAPAGAASNPTRPINWNQRDTAAYVVSTLNLLHARSRQSFASVLQQRLGVSRYDVYADAADPNLYFILLKTDAGNAVGGLAYQMGWVRPKSLNGALDRFHIPRAPADIQKEFASDAKQLIGSFTSTLPS